MNNMQTRSMPFVRVHMPPAETLEIQLLPSTTLCSFEEYKSDENLAHLVLGICGSGIVGIVVDLMNPTVCSKLHSAVILFSIFAFGLSVALLWLYRIRSRLNLLKEQFNIK